VPRLHKQLKRALQNANTLKSQHRARILAKRLRYGIEALQPLLRRRRTQRWLEQATELQTGMGTARDVMQAGVLLGKLEAEPALVEFLRGIAFGQGQT
jgi:CHAD domain-containing protein